MTKLYEAIASSLLAARNCEASGNVLWKERHLSAVEQYVRDYMPSGSGFDDGTRIVIDQCDSRRMTFTTSYHQMDDNGMYCGWFDYSIVARPSFDGIVLTVRGSNQRATKDYVHDTFYEALTQSINPFEQAAPYGLAEVEAEQAALRG